MKLFKSLLVAPATLGLLAPMTATANEVTISDFTPAEQLAITNSRVDGLEARLNNIEAGSFSETTTASFSVDMAIGAVDGLSEKTTGTSNADLEGDQTVQAVYGFQIDLNTSFTGEDSLDISLDAGNGKTAGPLAEFDLNGQYNDVSADLLSVDGVSYTFPATDNITAIVGDNTDGSALFTTACAYGGPSNTLDDCGNVNAGITNGGFAVGGAYDFENGWTAALGYAGPETNIMSKEGADAYGANVAYTADNYGVSLTYGAINSTTTSGAPDGEKDVYTALNAFYSFDSGLSVSAGYEVGDLGGELATADESINYFVGVSSPAGPGELGAALGTSGGQIEGQDDELMYEAYYSYPLNDGMTITPLVFVKEKTAEGVPDQTGVMVKTSFSF